MTIHVPRGYSAIQILLHWLVALLVLFELVFGESMGASAEAAEEGRALSVSDQFLADAHYWVGIAILGLVALRLLARLWQDAPPAPNGTPSWMEKAATATHWLFYILLVVVPVTGLLALYVSEEFGEIHSLGKPVFIVLIALHASAALFHQFWIKDGALKRILVPVR